MPGAESLPDGLKSSARGAGSFTCGDFHVGRPRTRYSLDEAVTIIRDIHMKLESIEAYRLKLKWWIGFVLTHTDRPHGSKTEIIDEISARLWSDYRIRAGKTKLYESAKLYEGLSGDYRKFVEWIDRRKKALHRPVYWYDVVNDLLGGRNNPAVIGQAAADEQDFLDAERTLEAIERIIVRAAEGSEEADGALEGLRQTVIGLMLLNQPPAQTPRSEEYVRFVRARLPGLRASIGSPSRGRATG